MKIPLKPPSVDALLAREEFADKSRLRELMGILNTVQPDPKGRYYHWDKLRHLKLPPGIPSHEQWWLAIKIARKGLYKEIPHQDKYGKPFVHAEPGIVHRLLHDIDLHGGGELKARQQIANSNTRDMYLLNSLREEAITSSQLEGAATTKKVAKEMLRLKRKPHNRSETMIYNNYQAMEFVRESSGEALTIDLICELHRVITANTLSRPDLEGALRRSDDIFVADPMGVSILHEPPKAEQLRARLQSICNFANATDKETFQHPVSKAIILHFLLAYDHPFEDGNGRTARALFYWAMLRQGYWAMAFVSISSILKKAPARYSRAYLYTETDDNDVTYFIVYQLEVITRSIQALLAYLDRKVREVETFNELTRKSPRLRGLLNHRQIAVINRALRKPEAVFYVKGHQNVHNVVYQTARMDLLSLVDLGLLAKVKTGNAFEFIAINDLEQKIKEVVASHS